MNPRNAKQAKSPATRALLAFLAVGLAVAAGAWIWLGRDPLVPAQRTDDPTARTELDAPASSLVAPEMEAAREVPATAPGATELTVARTRDALLEVLVQGEDQAPLSEARLAIVRGAELLGMDTTDAHDLARFAPSEGSAEVVVLAPGRAILRAPIEVSAGRRTVTLPDGAKLAGWVLVDGALPARPIRLQFVAREASAAPELPEAARLELWGREPPHAFTTTGDGGTFEFRGFAHAAGGTLAWEVPYLLDDGVAQVGLRPETSVEVPALRTDFELRLLQGLELRLRVVDDAGGPVPHALVLLEQVLQARASLSHTMHRGAADRSGRFRASLGSIPCTRLSVRVSRKDGWPQAKYPFDVPELRERVWDLGDLAIPAARELLVRVQDVEGRPIAGAAATPLPQEAPRPSGRRQWMGSTGGGGADGTLEIAVVDDADRLLVQAVGYASELLPLAGDASEIVAVLQRACLLEVHVAGVDPKHVERLMLTLSGAPPIFADELPGALPSLQMVGGSFSFDETVSGTSSLSFDPDSAGRWRFSNVAPGIPLRLELKHGSKPALARRDVEPLQPGEHRTVAIELATKPGMLRVEVRDPSHVLVPHAKVRFGSSQVHSAPGGVCTLGPIFDERFDLCVEAPGFAPQAFHGLSIPPDELSVVLDEGRQVEVDLVDAHGAPFVESVELSANLNEGPRFAAVALEPGRWRFGGLPSGEIEIVAQGTFGLQVRVHDTSVPTCRLVVGGAGRIVARFPVEEDPQARAWSAALYAPGDATPLARLPRSGSFRGLPFGAYEVWLETRDTASPWNWVRTAGPYAAVLEERTPTVEVELRR